MQRKRRKIKYMSRCCTGRRRAKEEDILQEEEEEEEEEEERTSGKERMMPPNFHFEEEEKQRGATQTPKIDCSKDLLTRTQNAKRVGGRLQMYWKEWKDLELEESVIAIVKEGMRITFTEKPGLTTEKVEIPMYINQEQAAMKLAEELLEKKVIEKVVIEDSPGFYQRWFLVPKKTPGKWRAILDLRKLNMFVKKEKFQMETSETIKLALRQGDYVTSIDLTDAYYHIMIHPAYRCYLRFQFNGEIYQYRALPMGLTSSPRIFTKLIKAVKGYLQRLGIEVHQYLDDWLIRATSIEKIQRDTRLVLRTLTKLGFIVNVEKSELVPKQTIIFLGQQFQLDIGRVLPTQEKKRKIIEKLNNFIQRETAPALEWQKVIGLLTAVEKLMPGGRLRIRPLQIHLNKNWKQNKDSQQMKIQLTPEVKEAIKWWLEEERYNVGVRLETQIPQENIYTDASMTGWGGHWNKVEVSGTWTEEEKVLHINVLEMKAVIRTITAFQNQLRNKTVLLASDNTTVIAYIRKQGGTRSSSMFKVTQELFQILEKNGINMQVRHIAGRLNVLADQLSRRHQMKQTEWSLHPQILNRLWKVIEKPQIDLFATRHNAKMTLFVSPIPDPEAWAVDAMSISWDALHAYAFPPIPLLNRVVEKARRHNCVITLIAPFWPKQTWFPRILELLVETPVKLPATKTLLKQPRTNMFHPNPSQYNLHVWILSNNVCKRKAFLEKLPRESLNHIENQVEEFTKHDGKYSVIGVLENRRILAWHL